MRGFPGIRRSIEEWSAAILVAGLFFVFHFHGVPPAAAGRVYNAADLVRAARMLEGIIPADPEFADLDGDGQVTADDLALMLRRVHGQELPVRLEQKTIGAAGGSIGSADTILLTVPPGAFAATETLTLERMPPGELPRSSGDHGPLYQISGIPFDAATSLTVRVAVPEGLDLDGTHVEVGHLMFGRPRGFGWYYLLEDSEPNGNALFWQLGPVPASVWDDLRAPESVPAGPLTRETVGYHTVASHRTNYMIRVLYFTNYRELTGSAWFEAPRFSIRFPRERSSPGAQVPVWLTLDVLEESFTALTNAGFDFSTRTKWPIKVTFKDLGQSDGEVPWASTMNRYQIHLHEKLLDNWVLLRPTAAHEFFHVVQGFYSAPNRHVMLNEATATWFEKYIADGDPADYLPEHFPLMPRTALRGMHIEPGLLFGYSMKDVQSRGYTVASFIEYADRRHNFGLAGIAQLYARLKAGDHAVLALMTAIPGDAADFKNLWRDYTRDFFNAPVWPAGNTSTLLADPPPPALSASFISELNQANTDYAFRRRAEGPFGRILSIDNQDDYATLREARMRVQQLGARSLAVAMMDPGFTDQLPDTVRMIGEVQWENEDDLPNLRLVPVFDGGPGPGSTPPTVLPLDAQTWIMSRSTHRVEVSFPRPPGRFTYMLGVFNDDVRAPYDRTPTVTLRSYIGSYRVPPTEPSTRLLSPTEPVAVGELRDAMLDGDLGTVRSVDLMSGPGLGVRDILGLMVMLPHDDRTPLRLRLDGGLKQPLERVIEHNQTRWTVTATEDVGWRLTSSGSGIEGGSIQGEVVTAADAWNTGFTLSAPEAGGVTQHSVSYYFSASVLVEDLNEYGASSPYTWTTDSWYVVPLVIILRSPQAP